MKVIKPYKNFLLEYWVDRKKDLGWNTVSFDFDGVLHRSMVPGTGDPIDFWDWKSWEPFKKIHKKVFEEAADGYNIVICTHRPPEHNEQLWNFVHKYKLPISRIINVPWPISKSRYLEENEIFRHYDDNSRLEFLPMRGIEFVDVSWKNQTMKLTKPSDLTGDEDYVDETDWY